MDIAQFYDGDRRRREAPEVGLGNAWVDGAGQRWRVAWIPGTGELYAMREPEPLGWPVGNGGWPYRNVRNADLVVSVLARIADESMLREVLGGFEQQHDRRGGLEWLLARVGEAIDAGHAVWTYDGLHECPACGHLVAGSVRQCSCGAVQPRFA